MFVFGGINLGEQLRSIIYMREASPQTGPLPFDIAAKYVLVDIFFLFPVFYITQKN